TIILARNPLFPYRYPMPHTDPRLHSFPHVCIVEASAGTGKTYALARRYIQLLMDTGDLGGCAPFKGMLAITFSNKAVLEMKERILYLLKRLALGGFADPGEEAELLGSLGLSAAEARRRARQCMDALMRNYNFFQVQTIDSFMNAILSGCAFHLGLSSSFRIRRDWPEFLAFSLDTLIDRGQREKKIRRLFEEALRQYLYLESRSGWFPKREIFRMMRDLFEEMNRRGREYLRSAATPKALAQEKKGAVLAMRRLARLLPASTHKQFAGHLEKFLAGRGDSFDFKELSRYWHRQELPAGRDGRVPAAATRAWQAVRGHLEAAAVLESLLIFKPYADIFAELLVELRRDLAKEDVLFLDELNFRAHELVGRGAVSLPELYYRLAVRLKHFLVDEFQDTSPLQWANLDAMVEEALSTGGSLFYVGDKKQAIYRFRGGDVRLFDHLRDRFASFPVIPLTLDKNRRSLSELVHFCNTVFSQENLGRFLADGRGELAGESEGRRLLEVFQGARQDVLEEGSGGFVCVEVVEGEDAEERAGRVRERVFEVLDAVRARGYGWQDVAVLVRENEEVESVSEWLLGRGIPVASEKTLNIRNHPRVKEVVSLLRFLNKPVDDLAFVAFLLGDIFCRASGRSRAEMEAFVFGRPGRGRTGGAPYLYRSFRERYPDLWQTYFENLFKGVGFVPLYELVVQVLAQFRCFEAFASEQGFFMRLLELIKEREEESAVLTDFLEFFDTVAVEELYLKGMSTAAVRVMTVHKAKGLGFPVVILPFLSIRPRVAPLAVQETPEGLLLRRVGGKYAGFSADLDAVETEERIRSLIDEMNSVYVGLTRARAAMWVFLPQGPKRAGNPLAALFPEEVRRRGELPVPAPPAAEVPAGAAPIGLARYGDWVPALSDEFADTGALARRDAIRRGEVLHALFSWVADAGQRDAREIWGDIRARALARFPFVADWGDYEEAFLRALSTEALAPFFRPRDARVLCEQEFVYADGSAGRVDRLIIQKEEVWVVDYKSSRQEARDGAVQVRRYVETMGRVFAGRRVRGYLIFLDNFQAEEVP
ncbi:MAG: UvrD-helicase domain-containing protein, partial [Deltaproteobacteria bacterium]